MAKGRIKGQVGRSWLRYAVLILVFLAACSEPKTMPSVAVVAVPEVGDRLIGAYIWGGVWKGFDTIEAVEAEIGHNFAITHWFTNWDNEWEDELVELVLERERIPLISWQNHTQSVTDIAAGKYDGYIRRWAQGIARSQGEVYVRLFPEMNGDWVPWNGEPERLVAAWQRIATLFDEEGATNVRWVWSPNVTDGPRTLENRMENYYPGHDYVDVLAMDGYNWGRVRPWSSWRSFEAIFNKPYKRLTKIGPQRVWLAEIASAERGGDKGKWIADMLSSTAFPRLEAVVWFSEHKDADWRIESSQASLDAFKTWFARKNTRASQRAQITAPF